MNAGSRSHSGLPQALGAYLLWGLLPLYFHLLRDVAALEVVGWRVLFTVPVCLVIVAFRHQFGQVAQAFSDPRTLRALVLSAFLIATNWVVYVFAIATDHVFAASLGYYINPLMNVLAGTVFLGERLSARRWLAVGLAAVGVTILAWGALNTLWVSMTLAVSFCGYGLVRKVTPVGSLPGLTVETVVLIIPATAVLFWLAGQPGGLSLGDSTVTTVALGFAGVITGLPLLMFATAARRMSYSALGFVQFLTPTMVFLQGLLVFHEPLKPVQLASFAMIWSAIAVFCWDLLKARRPAPQDEVEAPV
ncbi:EamA family transporter RarD [Novosphingobium sp. RD2P27]|uniref:EamA family transporter RarD n=1 Tax=Novosphingobium kalidii TaxID=3230299 RepID=A0ABV2D019_9SPHN